MSTRSGTFFSAILVLAVLVSVMTCQPPLTEPVPSDYTYFPLIPGRYVLYDVDETQYALNAPPVHRRYQLKETVGAVYTGLSGETAYKLVRHRRSIDTQPWLPDSVWTARLVRNEAIRGENGRDFVALVFPLSNGLRWNGNRYNPLGPDEYELRNRDQPYRVGNTQFDDTVTVVAEDDSTLIAHKKRNDIYARHVGLVYRERTQLYFCTSPACAGKNQIDYGTQYIYRIRQYGQE